MTDQNKLDTLELGRKPTSQPERDAMGRFLRPPDNIRRTGRKRALDREILESLAYTYPPITLTEIVVKAEMAADKGDAKVSGAYLAIARFVVERLVGKPGTSRGMLDEGVVDVLTGFLADDNDDDDNDDGE